MDERQADQLEITETTVIRDLESAIANLKTFAATGVTLSMDDYGA